MLPSELKNHYSVLGSLIDISADFTPLNTLTLVRKRLAGQDAIIVASISCILS